MRWITAKAGPAPSGSPNTRLRRSRVWLAGTAAGAFGSVLQGDQRPQEIDRWATTGAGVLQQVRA
jgi:hypothetical protein